jgi:serine/threonine protein kinase
MSAGEPPPSDPEAFAPTIAPSTAQRPPVVTAPFGRTTTKDVGARDVGQASYQDTVAIGSGAPTGEAAAIDDLPLTDPALYVSEREVARGGMGRIIAAHDRILGRPVALKELLHADPSTRRGSAARRSSPRACSTRRSSRSTRPGAGRRASRSTR